MSVNRKAYYLQNKPYPSKKKGEAMEKTAKNASDDILADFSPFFRVYKDGRVERLNDVAPVRPSIDSKTGVQSKDRVISSETGVSVRIFNPKNTQLPTNKKIPILMYCHGSGFCSGSTFSPLYYKYLNRLCYKAQILIVSVEYRKATEHPLPAAYNDCWDALIWIFSHDLNNRDITSYSVCQLISAKETWLDCDRIDFSRVFVAGESSGANIAHQVALRAGVEGLGKLINGIVLVQPFFWGKELIGDEIDKCSRGRPAIIADNIWAAARWGSPSSVDDPWINPAKDTRLGCLGCKRVLICVAEKDRLRDRGLLYKFALEKSGWSGDIQVVKAEGEDHAFHLMKPYSPTSVDLMRQIVDFVSKSQSKL